MAWPSGCEGVSWVPDCRVFSTFPLSLFPHKGQLDLSLCIPTTDESGPFYVSCPSFSLLPLWDAETSIYERNLCCVLIEIDSGCKMLYIRQWFLPVAMQIKHIINSVFSPCPLLAHFYHNISMRTTVSVPDLTQTLCPTVKVGCVRVVSGWYTMCWLLCPECFQQA